MFFELALGMLFQYEINFHLFTNEIHQKRENLWLSEKVTVCGLWGFLFFDFLLLEIHMRQSGVKLASISINKKQSKTEQENPTTTTVFPSQDSHI